jgi:hypothetical protein
MWVKPVAFAFGGALLLCAASASQAALVELRDGSGTAVGWQVQVPDVDAANVSLSFVRSANGTFYFNKTATFTRNSDPIILVFQKTSASAPNLAIATEAITNNTGIAWNGYRLFLSSGSNASGAPAFTFGVAPGTVGLGAFAIDPFTTFAFANNSQDLVFGGGTVASGATFRPGSSTAGGLLIINSGATGDHFSLKEIPTPIPLPAAAWTGLSGLLGLAVIGAGKSLRQRRIY